MAKVVNINIDSRREIDQELKKVCGEFTKDTIIAVVEPLSAFMIKLSTKKTSSDDNEDPSSNVISSDLVYQTVAQFQEAADERLRYTIKKLQEYINDVKMEQILLKPVEINVMDYYKTFYQTVTSENGSKIQSLEKPLVSIEEMATYISHIINDSSTRTPSPATGH
ncbi:hypothetical protein BCR42DRAFT_414323 [Absidia repens]|uniref:Uncharacterized protein n=1 Tax=Absidia repens TaxID=90262 RepID=A0A1X2IIU5_9FUNG|nr:hypothetical protein BCR42DRAFT_414323 [Absidia repens]